MHFAYIIISWWEDDFSSAEVIKKLSHEDADTMIFGTEEEAIRYAEENLNWSWQVVRISKTI